jgi:hypothetical protein
MDGFPTVVSSPNKRSRDNWYVPSVTVLNVDKAVMAPGISKSAKSANARRLARVRNETLSPNQMMPASQAKHVLKKISSYITKNFENVGDRFYKEAVRCEEGDRDDRFYGTPSKEDTDKLLDKGIDLFHVPKLKDN